MATPLKIFRAIVICTAFWIALASPPGSPAFAQELEPRRWSHLPIGQNFASLIYARTEGDISFDPELGIEEAQGDVDTMLAGYVRSFALFDRSARIEVRQAWQHGRWDGLVNGVPTVVERDGPSDTFVRLASRLRRGKFGSRLLVKLAAIFALVGLVPGVLIKRAMKGTLALKDAAHRVQAELVAPLSPAPSPSSDPIAAARRMALAARKTALLMLGLASQTYGDKLGDQQEVLMLVTDMLIDAYTADSAARRAGVASRARPATAPLHADAATVIAHDAAARVEANARVAIAAMQEGDAMKTSLAALKKILKVEPVNTVAARRRIGQAVAERKAYVFA